MTREECYKIFGFDKDVILSEQLIKNKYRSLSKLYHPDNNRSKDAVEKLYQINEAYECLLNRKFEEKSTTNTSNNTNNTNNNCYSQEVFTHVYNNYKTKKNEAEYYRKKYEELQKEKEENERKKWWKNDGKNANLSFFTKIKNAILDIGIFILFVLTGLFYMLYAAGNIGYLFLAYNVYKSNFNIASGIVAALCIYILNVIFNQCIIYCKSRREILRVLKIK